jgi:hypothetical protein
LISLSPELKRRELQGTNSKYQDSGFEVTDKIKVYLQKNDTLLRRGGKGMFILNQKTRRIGFR